MRSVLGFHPSWPPGHAMWHGHGPCHFPDGQDMRGFPWHVLTIRQMAWIMTITHQDTSSVLRGPDPWHPRTTSQFLLSLFKLLDLSLLFAPCTFYHQLKHVFLFVNCGICWNLSHFVLCMSHSWLSMEFLNNSWRTKAWLYFPCFFFCQIRSQLAVLVPTKAVGLEFVLTNVKTTHSVRQSREPSVVVRLVVASVVYNRVQRSHAQPAVQQDMYSTRRDVLPALVKVLTLSPRESSCTDTQDSAIMSSWDIFSRGGPSTHIAPV